MEKIKIYLDTNTIVDYFINQARAIKKGEELKMTEKMRFFVTNLDKFDFLTSFLIKTEVGRELVSSFKLSMMEVENLWNSFTETLGCKIIIKFEFGMELADLTMKTGIKLRTIVNFQHLLIAIDEDAYFVTGDKNLIKIANEKKIYDKVLSYLDLREMIT